MKTRLIFLTLLLLLLMGCDHHDHGHDHDSHQSHNSNAATIGDMDDFSDIEIHDDHGHEHDDHGHESEHDHGHGDEASVTITNFSEKTELFVEFPALVVGQESMFAAHLTILDTYKPVTIGTVTVTLTGGGVADEVFRITTNKADGIFRPVVIPQHPVQRNVILELDSEGLSSIHQLGMYTVYPSQALALADVKHEEDQEESISYLKEQQWQVDFAVAKTAQKSLRASVQAVGVLRPAAEREAYLSAASTGHVQKQGKFPHVGMTVKQGQVLANIVPYLGTGGDLATLKAALDKARSEFQLAQHERVRLQKLWKQKAVPEHRLHEAESAEAVTKAEFEAADRRYKQSTGGQQRNNGIPVRAPISGVLAKVSAAPGKYVHEGDELFHIVDLERLWLQINVPEVELSRLQQPTGAWFSIEGFADIFNTENLNGRLVAQGGIIESVSRTAPLIFEFDNHQQRLRSGMFSNTRVFTGEVAEGVVVPQSAVYDDGGQEVIYVMLGGESFERRMVRLGIREAGNVIVKSGVEAGEWVVSKGAYQVRLASASPAEAGHGHAH